MDPKVYDAISQAVAAGLTASTAVTLIVAALLTIASAFLAAYVKKKAETLATKTDFEVLRNQLQENTQLTEDIKQNFSKRLSVWQEQREFRQRQLQEFYGPLVVLVQRGNWIQRQLDERLERSVREHGGGGTKEWVTILKFFYDTQILPLRAEIREVFKTKSFLMEEEPQSVREFLRLDAQEVPFYQLWRATEIEGGKTEKPWTDTLEDDLRRVKERLEAEVRRGIGLPTIAPPSTVADG